MKIRILLVALTGFLFALSFPSVGVSSLTWVSLFPLIFLSVRSRPLRALVYGFIFGEAFFLTLLYWIYHVLDLHASLGFFLSVLILLLLTSYLALYPSLFAFLTSKAVGHYGPKAVFLSPFLWVGLEYVRGHLFSGFPWGSAGYSLASVTPLIQMASLAGVYGLSFLIVLTNVSIACLFLERRGWKRTIPVLFSLILIALVFSWGSWRISRPLPGGRKIAVACIQGNYGANVNADVDESVVLSDYVRRTREAAVKGSRFIVWPESTTFFEVCCTPGYADLLKELCSGFHVDLVLGSVHRNREEDREKGEKEEKEEGEAREERYFNSAFHITADGEVGERYDKIHLVPYGEYVPMPKILFFVKRFVQAAGDFSRGEDHTIMDHQGEPFSVLICYEVIFPEFVRNFSERGSSFFINITNDAWFGSSSAPDQHFDFLKLRAVENGRYFVRSASTGISGIISPYGEVLKRTEIFTQAVLDGEIRTLHHRTVYSRVGHWFPAGCAIILLILTLCLFFSSWKRAEPGKEPGSWDGITGEPGKVDKE